MNSQIFPTRPLAVETAVSIGGGYIGMQGNGARAKWHFLGQTYPGHSDFVFLVQADGVVRSVWRCATALQ